MFEELCEHGNNSADYPKTARSPSLPKSTALKKCESLHKEERIKRLESFANDLKIVKRQDRLGPIKRETMGILSKAYEELGKLEKALHWADMWVAFDERDLYAQVRKAQLMCRIPELTNEGKDLLARLYKKVPEAEVVTNAYWACCLNAA